MISPATIGTLYYRLVCVECGQQYVDDGTLLACPRPHGPALLRSEYAEPWQAPAGDGDGIARYGPWLPGRLGMTSVSRPAVYRARPRFAAEGGVRNVGRRDGLATTMMTAYEAIGGLPDWYVQAIGSGTGAIGAYEASRRLAGDGPLPRLLLCQNDPFRPIVDAWAGRTRTLPVVDEAETRRQVASVVAPELTNRRPPYAIAGGVYDALTACGGDAVAAGNDEARAARDLFEAVERIDIDPAPAVALAGLRAAVATGRVASDATVLLHVTGGGRIRRELDDPATQAPVRLRVAASASAVDRAVALFADELGR